MADETQMDSPRDQPPPRPRSMPDGQPPITDSADTIPANNHHLHGRLLHSRGAVLSFLFLVAGVVGLPLLWVNPNFSRGERILWSVIILLYSMTILILAGGMMWWIYQLIFGA